MPEPGSVGLDGERALILHHQKQVISADQARAVGISRGELRWKVESGRWQGVYRGVYATFSGELSHEARLWAVVLRMGDGAALSHPRPMLSLPVMPLAQTVLDLVASARTHDDAYAWLSRAVTRNKLPIAMITSALADRRKMRRRTWLEDALRDISDGAHFPIERRWARDVEHAHGLPTASRQARREGADGVRYLDNYYEPYNLAVELDGLAFHPAEDRDLDRHRDNETSIAASAATLRYGFKEVANHPCEQAEQFARALIKHGWPAATLKACRPNCPVATTARLFHAAKP